MPNFLNGVALAGAAVEVGLTMSAPTPVSAAEPLKLAYFMSDRHPMNKAVFTPFAEKLAELSGGELTIEQFPGGALGGGPVPDDRAQKNGAPDTAGRAHCSFAND